METPLHCFGIHRCYYTQPFKKTDHTKNRTLHMPSHILALESQSSVDNL